MNEAFSIVEDNNTVITYILSPDDGQCVMRLYTTIIRAKLHCIEAFFTYWIKYMTMYYHECT